MKILLTGATGYIGKRLLPVLIKSGHRVVCCVRDASRFHLDEHLSEHTEVIEVNFLESSTLGRIPQDIDAAYYLLHSMSSGQGDFEVLEERSARNFVQAVRSASLRHVIYLSGIINEEHLSAHLRSRQRVEEILMEGDFSLTTLRAGIIIGSGSASFEIIRDLVEKLPVMIAPKWLNTRSQPIAVRNVLQFLEASLFNKKTFNRDFDIGGPDVLTYREMLMLYAKSRGLRRWIISVPVLTPRLSSYWLYFITSTTYSLAVNLVDSMKIDVTCRDQKLAEILGVRLIPYSEAVSLAFQKIDQNAILSSWKDSMISGRISERLGSDLSSFIRVPEQGCFKDRKIKPFKSREQVVERIWSIGGETGWYFANTLWKLRGLLDKLMGGVGLRRGRTSVNEIRAGDTLDFWRVLLADKPSGRLLLYAEMKLPGEAWLEFRVHKDHLIQEATFRPKGVAGRLYWYILVPVHYLMFNGMITRITR